MTGPSDREHGDPPDEMAQGLKAAFAAAPEPQRASVLRRLQKKTGSQLDLHLHVHDAHDEESDAPVRIGEDAKALRDPTGRYLVLGEIGRGGVGVVFKGRDQDLGRDVAMKVLRPEHVSRPEIVERFVEEAQIGGQLQHPGIVPVYEIGLQAGERPYFAMKLVKGQTLAELLAQRKSAADDRRRFLGIFEQVCQTIAYAHARRVVHRDIKPHNVMIGSFGEVQVVDWGFAKVLPLASAEAPAPRPSSIASVIATVRSDPKKGSHSVVGSMMGTPAYMPPEQALGDVERMDQRSDVFGLGAMFCEILIGHPPYLAADGDVVQQAARADLQKAYDRIERSGADAVLVALCKQCLAPARQARPDSAKQVAEAIAHYLTSVEERARQAQIHAAEAKVRARATLMLSAAAVLVLALGGGGYLHLQRQEHARRDQANARVATALNEANVRLAEARANTPPDLALWARAADATTQAGQLASEPDVGDEEQRRAVELLSTVHDEQSKAVAAAAQLDREASMERLLLEVRSNRLDAQSADYMLLEYRRREQGYSAAFASWLGGRDVATMGRDEALQALSGRIAVALAAGLDGWCGSIRYLVLNDPGFQEDPALAPRLGDLASTIDPDPWRVRLRTVLAAKERDRLALAELHRKADLASLPAASMLLLASALVDQDVAAAQEVYERARERFPTDFSFVFQLGLLHGTHDHFAQADACFRTALALKPDMHEAKHQLGKALTGLGEHREEERLFRELAATQPGEAHWAFHVGLALRAQGKLDEAADCFRRAIELDPKQAIFHVNLGLIADQQGRVDEAIEHYRDAIAAEPGNADGHINLGNVFHRQQRIDDAIASCRRAIELTPKDPHCHYNLGKTLADEGRLDDAIASYRRAIELDPKDAVVHDSLGSAFAQQGRLDDAVASMRRSAELQPDVASFHYDLAILLGQQGRLVDAIASYRRAIELDPRDPRYHMNLGNILSDRNLPEEALASYRRAESLWSERQDAEAIEWRANAKRAITRLETWMKHRDRLLAVLRGDVASKDAAELFEAATSALERGDLQLAVRAWQLVLEITPKDPGAHCNLGLSFERLGRFADAIPCYERAIELLPTAWHFHLNLANALMENDEPDDAIATYRAALDLDPKNATVRRALGAGLRKIGDLDESIANAEEAIELAPAQSWARFELGVALHEANRDEEALACFRKAIELDPKSADAHHSVGVILIHSGRPSEALPSYRKAVELDPKRWQYQLDLGLLLDQLQQFDASVDCYRRVLEQNPDDAIANYKLGWYAQDKRRWDDAIDHYRRTIASDPNHAEAHCNLASCLACRGQFVEALELTRRGHELGSKRPDWSYPSAEWVRLAETRLGLEAKLPALLAGEIRPADDAERIEYIRLCAVKGLNRRAVELTLDAFAADQKLADDPDSTARYDSAICAALAGAGRGNDLPPLDLHERAVMRKQALDWLRSDLARHAKKLETGEPAERAAVKDTLRVWQQEEDLASIRSASSLAELAPEERNAFAQLWADVAKLLGT